MNNKALLLGIDVGVAAGLLGMLVLVIGVDAVWSRLSPDTSSSNSNADAPAVTVTKSGNKTAHLAVTEPFVDKNGPWDDVGKLLDEMGDGYKYDNLKESDLKDLDKLKRYDVIFLCCSSVKSDFAVAQTLRAYVSNGGTLYASDWRYEIVAQAFPDMADADKQGSGMDLYVLADVVDQGLRDVLGAKLRLTFELNKWKTSAFGGDRVKVLLRGKYTDEFTGNTKMAPLLVKFTFGKGNVIFTSYHHGKTHSEVEQKLLKHLIYSLMTAKTEAEIEQTLLKSQFSPAKSNLFSASTGDPHVTYTYTNEKPGKLRFDMGFTGGGAKLKLAVKMPNGDLYAEKSGTSNFFIEVPNAPAGDYKYTITALQVPHENYAFNVTVSSKK
jgi:hypothetical protein